MEKPQWIYYVTVTDYAEKNHNPKAILELALRELSKEIDVNNSLRFNKNAYTSGVKFMDRRLMALFAEEVYEQIQLDTANRGPERFGHGFGHTAEAIKFYNL